MRKQNCHYWAPKKSHESHQRPLHSAKVIAWCAISSNGITGPCFFENAEGRTVQSMWSGTKSCWENVCEMSPVFNLICYGSTGMVQMFTQHRFPCKLSGQCFQAGSLLVLETSPSPLGPDLAERVYFLWGYVQSKVYKTRPANSDYIKQLILECIQSILKDILKRVMPSFPSRLQECTEKHGGHLHGVFFKQ
jgi:hypothetical protein